MYLCLTQELTTCETLVQPKESWTLYPLAYHNSWAGELYLVSGNINVPKSYL